MAEQNLGDEQGGEEYVKQVAACAASVAAAAVPKAANAARLAELAAAGLIPPDVWWDIGALVAFERLVNASEAEFPEADEAALLAARAAGQAAIAAEDAECRVSVLSAPFTPLQAARLWSRLQVFERQIAARTRIEGRKRKR